MNNKRKFPLIGYKKLKNPTYFLLKYFFISENIRVYPLYVV